MSAEDAFEADATALGLIRDLAAAADPSRRQEALGQALGRINEQDALLVIMSLASHGATIAMSAAAARGMTTDQFLTEYSESADLARLNIDAETDEGGES